MFRFSVQEIAISRLLEVRYFEDSGWILLNMFSPAACTVV